MSMRRRLWCAGIGWAAGLVAALIVGFAIFPAVGGRTGGAGDLLVFGLALLVMSPGALAGGLIGGYLPREGGAGSQYFMAVLGGLTLGIPLSCLGLWYLGW